MGVIGLGKRCGDLGRFGFILDGYVGLGIDTVFAQNVVERKLRRGAFAGGIDCLAFEVFNGLVLSPV